LFKLEDVSKTPRNNDRQFELHEKWLPDLKKAAEYHKLDFLCTPFAPWAVDALKPYVDAWKISSFEAMRWDIYDAIGDDPRTKLISMGMCDDNQFEEVFNRAQHAIFMHCTSRYPAELKDSRMDRCHHTFINGFSDHTVDPPAAACAALGIGIRTFERHIRLDYKRQPPSPDDGIWSLQPLDMEDYVRVLRGLAGCTTAFWSKGFFKVSKPPPGRKVHGC
jgi:sialic acid synthase SpsE